MNNNFIGVFDSGIGGLTVLEELIKCLPNEKFLYIADQEFCPYGTKDEELIKKRVLKISEYLLDRKVKAIVIACNTASLFKKEIEKRTDVLVVDVINPTCKRAIETTKNNQVITLATLATINNGKYQELLKQARIKCYPVACSEFVDYLEGNDSTLDIEEIVKNKLSDLRNVQADTLIYGCTHFSILESEIKKILGNRNYLACGAATTDLLMAELNKRNLNNKSNKPGEIIIYTTGKLDDARKKMKWFKHLNVEIQQLEIK